LSFRSSASPRKESASPTGLLRNVSVGKKRDRPRDIYQTWRRSKKVARIETFNPTWEDLAADWGTTIAPMKADSLHDKPAQGTPFLRLPSDASEAILMFA
jgi:hypothetical protein